MHSCWRRPRPAPIWQSSEGQDYPLWHSLNAWEPAACPEPFPGMEPGQSLIIMWEKVASGELPFFREILPVLSVLPLPCSLFKGSKDSKSMVTLYCTTFRLRFCNRLYAINYSTLLKYFTLVRFGWNFWRGIWYGLTFPPTERQHESPMNDWRPILRYLEKWHRESHVSVQWHKESCFPI